MSTDWRHNQDQAYSCPRDWSVVCLSVVMCAQLRTPPETLRTHPSSIALRGL